VISIVSTETRLRVSPPQNLSFYSRRGKNLFPSLSWPAQG